MNRLQRLLDRVREPAVVFTSIETRLTTLNSAIAIAAGGSHPRHTG